jgi:hypothetical protein
MVCESHPPRGESRSDAGRAHETPCLPVIFRGVGRVRPLGDGPCRRQRRQTTHRCLQSSGYRAGTSTKRTALLPPRACKRRPVASAARYPRPLPTLNLDSAPGPGHPGANSRPACDF